VVLYRRRSLRLGMAGRGSGDTIFDSDGMSHGYDNENHAHTAKSQACVSL